MRKLGLLFIALAVISCSEKKPVDYSIVSGTILNKQGGEIIVRNQDQSSKKSIQVTESGQFRDTLRFEPGTYYIIDGRQNSQIYLENGSDIVIEYDAADFSNTLKFSGKGAGVSSYLLKKGKKSAELMGDRKDFYSLESDAYVAKSLEIKEASESLLNEETDVFQDFKEKELRNLNYEYLGKLNRYESYHRHFAEKPEFKISEGFLDPLKNVDYTNEDDIMFSSEYESLVSSKFRKQADSIVESDGVLEEIAYLKAINSSPSKVIKNKLLYNAAKYEITYTSDVESYYAEYMKGSTDEKNNKEISESYNKLKTVAKGNVSPKFENFENYKGGTSSLADLKGKYVYVDVWATWCGPCKAEIPSLKKVEQDYHGKNIEFVSISVDALKDHDKWKSMVADKELKGVQLFADKSWDSDFVKGYLIKGIPRFILIDPAGNIVTANAPRPSEEKLINLFDELNI